MALRVVVLVLTKGFGIDCIVKGSTVTQVVQGFQKGFECLLNTLTVVF